MNPRTLSWQGALSGKCGIFFKDEACGDSMGLCVLAPGGRGKGSPFTPCPLCLRHLSVHCIRVCRTRSRAYAYVMYISTRPPLPSSLLHTYKLECLGAAPVVHRPRGCMKSRLDRPHLESQPSRSLSALSVSKRLQCNVHARTAVRACTRSVCRHACTNFHSPKSQVKTCTRTCVTRCSS
jgi:hypothetical protein